MVKKEKRLITAALPYINNIPHLGHIVGSHLPADIFARYCRAKGHDTLFIGGSDENGTPCEIASEQLGIEMGRFLDTLYSEHKKIYDWFGISYDNFTRTSSKLHAETVVNFFEVLDKKGYIKEGEMEVFYSAKEGRYLPDRYVEGVCVSCGYGKASGDQCEKCSAMLNVEDLINPISTVSGEKVEKRKVRHLFFRLNEFSDKLEDWIRGKRGVWRSQVSSLALGWIKQGLNERCISRDLKHGISIPKKGYEDKVFYVWFDAPIGYLSGTKEVSENWEEFWKGEGKVYNFLGKDNIPFHTFFWPAMIMGHEDLNLPENVIGLQYLNYEGKKFSKSKGVGVFCEKLPEVELNPDVWRSYLTHIIPETSDSEFKWKDFMERTNSDLVGNYGNYVNRVIKFVKMKLDGKLERPAKDRLTNRDKKLLLTIKKYKKKIEENLEKAEIRKAYFDVLALSSEGNRYIHDSEPWNVVEGDRKRANDICYICIRLLKAVTTYIAPFLPNVAERVWKQMDIEGSPFESGAWDRSLEDLMESYVVGEPELLFAKMSEDDVERYREITSKGVNLKELF